MTYGDRGLQVNLKEIGGLQNSFSILATQSRSPKQDKQIDNDEKLNNLKIKQHVSPYLR